MRLEDDKLTYFKDAPANLRTNEDWNARALADVAMYKALMDIYIHGYSVSIHDYGNGDYFKSYFPKAEILFKKHKTGMKELRPLNEAFIYDVEKNFKNFLKTFTLTEGKQQRKVIDWERLVNDMLIPEKIPETIKAFQIWRSIGSQNKVNDFKK